MAFEISGTGRAIPARRVTNDELAKKIDTSDEWIRSHTGIGTRHIADDDCASSDLGLEAAKQALTMAEPQKTLADAALSVDIIVLATATPDFLGAPSTACIVQDKLGAKNAAAMDVTAGCTGFIYALETAAGILSIDNMKKRALVIGAEILTKFTDWTDRGSCVLFGDGAAAVVMDKTDAPRDGAGRKGLIRTVLRADGSGAGHLYFDRGGSRAPYKIGETIEKPTHIVMNGQAVYNFAVKALTDSVKDLLRLDNISIDDVAFIIPHQANARIVQAAAKRLKAPEEKIYLNIEQYANTSAASIPIALDELNRSGKLKQGDIILTIGFGGGLTYGGNLLVWS